MNVAAERAVLAGVFKHGIEAYDDIADIVTPNTFSVPLNQNTWACVDRVFRDGDVKHIDPPMLMSVAKDIGLSDFMKKSDDQKHIRALFQTPVTLPTVRKMAGKIRKLEISRLLNQQLDAAKKDIGGVTGDESLEEILGMAESPIFDFTSLLTDVGEGVTRMGKGAEDFFRHLMDNPREQIGIPTGFPRYDAAIGGGVRPNSLNILASRSKTGKTQLADNIAVNVARQNVMTLNVDTEMTREEHLFRIGGCMADIPVNDVETGQCGKNPADRARLLKAGRELEDLNYDYVSVIGWGFEEVIAKIRRWITRSVKLNDNGAANPCVILYDYLKILDADQLSTVKSWELLGFIATSLKNIAGRYKVPIISFVQQNRTAFEAEDETTISGSDQIVHYCTSLGIFKWKSEEEHKSEPPYMRPYTHKIVLSSITRHGPGLSHGDFIHVKTDYRFARVEEGPYQSEVESGWRPDGETKKQQKQTTVERTSVPDDGDKVLF